MTLRWQGLQDRRASFAENQNPKFSIARAPDQVPRAFLKEGNPKKCQCLSNFVRTKRNMQSGVMSFTVILNSVSKRSGLPASSLKS